jgi:O-methyltransferase involved in polyketide biosynthesis
VLLRAGFHPGQPSIWIIEGLLFYLKAGTAQHIMETVSQLAAADSWLSLMNDFFVYPDAVGALVFHAQREMA